MGIFGIGWVELLLIIAVVAIAFEHHWIIKSIHSLQQRTSRGGRQTQQDHGTPNGDTIIDIEPLSDPPSHNPPS